MVVRRTMKCLAITALCVQVVVLSATPSEEFLHNAFLDSSGEVRLWWTPRDDGILFRLLVTAQVERPGYVSVGISPDGGMTGADMAIAMLDAYGNVKLVDAHAVGYLPPVVDDEQDVQLLASLVDADGVQVTFERRDSCSRQDVSVTPNTAVHVVWAFGRLNPTGERLQYHENNRGGRLINLHRPNNTQFSPEEEEQLQYMDLLAPSVALPDDQQTLYHCYITKLPPQPRKSHFVGYKPLIEQGHEGLVHHILVYECFVPEYRRSAFERYVSSQTHAQCYSPNMPADWHMCRHLLVGWAVGGGGEKLPVDVGVPLHKSNTSVTYFLMETHYNNPQLKARVVDSSGVRLYYTERLRRIEGGAFIVGHSVLATMLVPPRRHRFPITGLCSSDCTREFPHDGITVYSVLLHAHLAGAQLKVHHLAADGRQLAPLASDPAYDFNYQQTWRLATPVRVMPGDQLLVECVYDTSGRDNMTFGGLATDSEMCQAVIGYYPRQPLANCLSAPDLGLLLTAIEVHTVEVDGETIPADEAGDRLQTFIDNNDKTNPNSGRNELAQSEPLTQSVREQMQRLPEPMRDAFLQLRDIRVSSEDGPATSSLFEYLLHLSWDEEMLQRLQEATSSRFRPQCRYRNGGVSSFDDQPVTGVPLGIDERSLKCQAVVDRVGLEDEAKMVDNAASLSSSDAAVLPVAVMLLQVCGMLL